MRAARNRDKVAWREPVNTLVMNSRRKYIAWGSAALLAVPVLVGAGVLLDRGFHTDAVDVKLHKITEWHLGLGTIQLNACAPGRPATTTVVGRCAFLGPVELTVWNP